MLDTLAKVDAAYKKQADKVLCEVRPLARLDMTFVPYVQAY